MASEIDRLRVVIEAMTARPWTASESAEVYPSDGGNHECPDGCDGGCDGLHGAPYPCIALEHARSTVADVYGLMRHAAADARGIAALRNVAPALIAAITTSAQWRECLAYCDTTWSHALPCSCGFAEHRAALDALAARIREALPEASRG